MSADSAFTHKIWDYIQERLGSKVQYTMLDKSRASGETEEAITFAFSVNGCCTWTATPCPAKR